MLPRETRWVRYVFLGTLWLWTPAVGGDEPVGRRGPGDRVSVTLQPRRAVIDIHSPTGIGDVPVSRIGPQWPDEVTVRLHLHGLECVRLQTASRDLQGAFPTSANEMLDVAPASSEPGRLNIVARDAQGKPTTTIPLKDGVFIVFVPRELLTDNPASLRIEWIDFYR